MLLSGYLSWYYIYCEPNIYFIGIEQQGVTSFQFCDLGLESVHIKHTQVNMAIYDVLVVSMHLLYM